MATKRSDSKVRFLAACAPRQTLLGVLAFPAKLDGQDAEHTRFYMVSPERWTHRAFDADLVSVAFEDGPNGKCWWLLGKRGDVYAVRPTGMMVEHILDAGTGPGKYGYLSSLREIRGRLFACGFSRQIYERTDAGWTHVDQGIVLDPDQMEVGLNDIAGNDQGIAIAVGDEGEVALGINGTWAMAQSPTNASLHAICLDEQGKFVAAGARGTVIRGDEAGFEVVAADSDFEETLWDVEVLNGDVVVAATSGLYLVRDGALIPFDKPTPPAHVGYRLVRSGNVLWAVGTHQILCLDGGKWTEWVCPDNET